MLTGLDGDDNVFGDNVSDLAVSQVKRVTGWSELWFYWEGTGEVPVYKAGGRATAVDKTRGTDGMRMRREQCGVNQE